MKLDGVLADKLDERDFKYSSTLKTLPNKVDLRKYDKEIEDQSSTGSCVANAACSALEILTAEYNIDTDLSTLFVYWNLREPYENLKGKDNGSYLRDAFKSISKKGVPSEKYWGFDKNKVNIKPDEVVYKKAKSNKVLEYRRVSKEIDDVKDALAKGCPVIFSMKIGKLFTNIKGNINKQKYKEIDKVNYSIGQHAMTIVGYDDNLKGFIVENSWGTKWGDKGYCLIPYEVFIKDVVDIWVCSNFVYEGKTIKPAKIKKNFLKELFIKIKLIFSNLF